MADGVYAAIHIDGGASTGNAGIIDLGDLTLIYDAFIAPQPAADLQSSAEALTGRPVDAVIDSHWHNDHTWGNQAFRADTDIISSEETRRMIIATRGHGDYEAFMVDGDDQTMVIDWAFVGRGPIGADLNPLVWMGIALGGVGWDQLRQMEAIVFEGYLEGLREAGWQGDPWQVRLGYTAASMRYLFPEIGRWLALIVDESLHAAAEQRFGLPIEETFDSVARTRRRLFGELDKARELIEILG